MEAHQSEDVEGLHAVEAYHSLGTLRSEGGERASLHGWQGKGGAGWTAGFRLKAKHLYSMKVARLSPKAISKTKDMQLSLQVAQPATPP